MLQALTPEQNSLIATWGREVGHDFIWLLILGAIHKIHKSLKEIRPGIVRDVTANVRADFDVQLKASALILQEHSDMDAKMFDGVTRKLESIEEQIENRFGHPRRHAQAHGD